MHASAPRSVGPRLLAGAALVAVLLTVPAGSPAAPGGCRPNLAMRLAATGSSRQLVTVVAPAASSTSGTVGLWRRARGCWSRVAGPWRARLGYNGVSDHHREGDGTTPAGAFGVGPVLYGVLPDPGVHYPYHRLVCGDWWDEDPGSPSYNTFQHVRCGVQPAFGGGSEALWEARRAYAHLVPLAYNTDPAIPGRGSAIFIHDDVGGPTSGCISLAPGELLRLLHWLRPGRSPLVVVGTAREIRRF